MHIGIDARMYGTKQRGIGRYLIRLIEKLEEISSAPPLTPPPAGGEINGFPPLPEGRIKEGWEFTIFLRRANWNKYQPKNPNFKKALWDAPWYGIREQLGFRPLFTKIRNPKSEIRNKFKIQNSNSKTVDCELSSVNYVYHFPHWNVPLLFRKPFVVTIHDLELFSSNRTRENSTRGRFMYWLKFQAFKLIFRHAVLAARAIIVPSNVVREQLIDRYPQVRKRVSVIYEAPTIEPGNQITKQLNNGALVQLFRQSVVQSKRYALYVGAAYPHKNLPRLLESWKLVHKELPDYKLVLVGREDWFWRKLLQGWSAPTPSNLPSGRGGNPFVSPPAGGGVRGGVLFYGSATDAELAALYSHAALLVQPSLEEGFSLAPLEALAFDCPVAVSDIPVHREILKDVPDYFNPLDGQSIAEGLTRLLTDNFLQQHIVTRGKTIVDQYSWRKHAQQTLALYETVKLR